jgi:DNA-3-methyladenine glycosylase II
MNERAIQHLSADPAMARVIASTTLDFGESNGDVYADLLDSIVSQQLSGKVVKVILGRFYALFPDGYPHPERILEMDFETLRSVGLSRQKTAYIRNTAEFFQTEASRNKDWSRMDDEEVIRHLIQIKGVGRWTAEMILMFTLKRPDILPLDDLGIQQSMALLFGWEETGKALQKRMLEAAEAWRPYRTYACKYLWKWPRV